MDNPQILEIIKKDFRQSNEWAEYISKLGFKPKILKNNSLIHEFKLGPFTILKSFRPELDDEAIDEIQSIADSKINLICKISPNINLEETQMIRRGYQIVNSTMSPIRTCVRDLTEDYDNIYKSFSENTRYKINRSIREKDLIEIIQKPTDKDIDNFYDLLEKRQKENKFMTYSRKEMKILRNCFKDDSFLITAYDIKGSPVVSNLYLRYLDKVTYFAGSLNSENHKSKAGYQLINAAFKYFKSQGVKVYDFEGLSDERDPSTYQDWIGYTNFKLKFGDKIFKYPVAVIKYNNFVFKNLIRLFGI